MCFYVRLPHMDRQLAALGVKLNPLTSRVSVFELQGQQINEAACDLAREVANEGDALVAGGVSQTPSYLSCKSENDVKAIFKKQMDVFVSKKVDFLIAEVCTRGGLDVLGISALQH